MNHPDHRTETTSRPRPVDERRSLHRGGWIAVVLGAVVVLGLVIGGAFLLAVGLRDDDTGSAAAPTPAAAGEDAQDRVDADHYGPGPHFPGRRTSDTSAPVGETIERDGLSMRADPLEPHDGSTPEDSSGLCAAVRIDNQTDRNVPITPHMFVVVGPDGTELHAEGPSTSEADDTMGDSELPPGQVLESTVCFAAPDEPAKGDYQLMYVGTEFFDQRLVWLDTL